MFYASMKEDWTLTYLPKLWASLSVEKKDKNHIKIHIKWKVREICVNENKKSSK